MKKFFVLSLILLACPVLLFSQKEVPFRHGKISSGFYLKIGAAIPVSNFSMGQFVPDMTPGPKDDSFTFLAPRTGPVLDLGFLIYTGPAFANRMLRAGIDATFMSSSFNPTNPDLDPDEDQIEYWYFFMGQKFGPVITMNPIDRLMLDFSYKVCTNFSYYDDWLGLGLWNQEVSFTVRYSIMAAGVQYHFGKINYNEFDKNNPDKIADISTVRVLFGLKF